MTYDEVIEQLATHRNERGIAHWKRLGPPGLDSFGIGLTQLRKLAKSVGRDHALAQQLWESTLYDAKVIGVLVDDPREMTRAQAEAWVEHVNAGMLAHAYCACNATLSKTHFARALAVDWMDNDDDDLRRRCGYLLLSDLAKNRRDPALTDALFEGYIDRIRRTIHSEANWVRDAMNGALLAIGKRNARLNAYAVSAAQAIGQVEVDYGDNGCRPPDVVKHLTQERLLAKLSTTTSNGHLSA